ncbi:oxidoreductase [Paenibacillus sp. MY03]|uniref:Gfo/Idh/MocA family protein n=1 Tax=Paenibacillus sp. MY03 TaxID=302980 RepID=UPI000B3CA6D9|nr:Gfo/Idh/MocA family oxidoreductase [Paenibacillus sp. MY03]OUS68777.1 oxidoreductase [Paenibacillus sp. MY03]
MGNLTFAIVGSGWVAGEYMKAIDASLHAKVGMVVSGNRAFAEARLAELGIAATVTERYEDAVSDPRIDAIVLCSTPELRPQHVELAAQHGKHLVIEKPLAMNRRQLLQMAEALERHPVQTVASFVLRWNPSFNNTKALIADDAIGRIYMAQIDYWHHVGPQYPQYRWSKTRALGGSSMLSAGCHAVDAVRYFAGEIAEVSAYSCRTWSDSDYEFDPNAIAIFKLRSGGIGKVSSSLECKTPYKFNVHLLGEKGAIMNNQLFSHKLPGQTDYSVIPTILPDSGDVSHHPFEDEINEFIGAIRGEGEVRCSFADAYKTMEACFAIDESIADGKPVALPDSNY